MATLPALNFDTPEHTPIIISVTLPAPNAGKKFTLREASGTAALAYKATQGRNAKMTDKSMTTDVLGVLESEYVLVGGCLYNEEDAVPRPVGTEFAKTLTQRILNSLFEKAKEISGLDNKPKTEAEWIKQMNDARAGLMEFRKTQGTFGDTDPKASLADSTPGS